MKRPMVLSCALCLLAGLLIGGILPMPWDKDRPSVPANAMLISPASSDGSQTGTSGSDPNALDSQDNFSLLNTACYAVHLFQEKDYAALAKLVHPERGVTFTPYSTVTPESDLNFSPGQIETLAADQTVYTWGFMDGSGSPIAMTFPQYIDQYVFNADYTQASQIGIDQIIYTGNALENLHEVYTGCRFVDFSLPGRNGSNQGLDWNSLKLVFAPGETCWQLVGVVHSQWTI